ncbi:MAG: hypothetical protein HY056_17340 [Proteobacteria bacterium]|nr:hypothetical protein [Pseudomonadota bacterium]
MSQSHLALLARLGLAAAMLSPAGAPARGEGSDPVPALVAAYNATGARLSSKLGEKAGNIVLSPYSIGAALAMVLAGARGETAREMTAALGHTLPQSTIEASQARLHATLVGDTKGDAGAVGRATGVKATLLAANALYVTAGAGGVAPDYGALIADRFSGELFVGADLEKINSWVKGKTEGQIDKVLDRLAANSVAVLVNAIYFKSRWAESFDVEQTRSAPFKLSGTQTIDVPTMRRSGRYGILALDGYHAIRLPYQDPDLAMTVVMPDDIEGVGPLAQRLTPTETAKLLELAANQPPEHVQLQLPRFKAQGDADLVAPLVGMGVKLAFDPVKADFSGITGRANSDGDVSISQIRHKAVVEVAEEGTLAAAATAVEVFSRSTARPTEIRVDRPFLFYITAQSTGAILFAGRVADPR